jgi:hypothetical protein
MTHFREMARSAFLFVALSSLLFSPRSSAQTQQSTAPAPVEESETNTGDGWHVGITPYLWFAGVHGTVGALGQEASVHASASDVLSKLNIGLMGAVEVRYNRVIIPVDFLWIKLSDDKALPIDVVAASIKSKMTEALLTPKVGYRIVDQRRLKVDAVFGVRYWHLTTDLTLQPTQIGNGFSRSVDWVDAVAGGKFQFALTPKLVVTVLGDAGGGSARSDYQIAGLLGYKVGRKCILQAGYRYLDVNYRPSGGFIYNTATSGLLLGATIDVK